MSAPSDGLRHPVPEALAAIVRDRIMRGEVRAPRLVIPYVFNTIICSCIITSYMSSAATPQTAPVSQLGLLHRVE